MNTMAQPEFPLFGIYEKAIRPQLLDKMFDDARSCGYDAFEMSLDSAKKRLDRLHWGARDIGAVVRAASDTGIKLLTACLSANKKFPLGSSDPDIVKEGMEIVHRAVSLCGALGIRVLQIPGFDVYDQETRTLDTQKRFLDNLAKCLKFAERDCVMLAIEPVEGNLLAVQDTMKVVRAIDSCWLQIYPDVANINSLGIDPVKELPFGKGHIAAVHMRDSVMGVYDATLLFGSGCLDFPAVFRTLDTLCYTGPLVVEMWNEDRPDYMQYITQACEFMKARIREVRKSHAGQREKREPHLLHRT